MYPDRPEAMDNVWQSSVWRWLETHPLAGEMHRWVLTTEEGEAVGHLAALPQFYRIDGQRVIAHTPADYQVLEGYGFHALSLMRRFFRTVENCVACDTSPAVIGVETRLGAEEAGRLQFAAKVWDVTGVPNFPRALRTPVPQILNLGLGAYDVVLTAARFADDYEVEVLERFDESFDELFGSVAAAVPCLAERDADFLRWRYGLGSPQASTTILGVRGEEGLLGYAAAWATVDADGYLLDLTTRPGRREVARSLLGAAIQHFKRAGVRTVRYRFVESPTSPRKKDVSRFGFVLGNRRRSALLVKFANPKLHETARDIANWSYTFGDGEATFWVR